MTDYNMLVDMALEAREQAYTPYSGFQVGAALLTDEGKIYKGCNIENASYSPTNCAERTAFFKAISEGDRAFKAIAIVGGDKNTNPKELDYCPPCGVCRQVMMEFVNPKTFEVILSNGEGDIKVYTLEDIFPMGFGPNNL